MKTSTRHFLKIIQTLKKRDVLTLDDLRNIIKESQEPKPIVENLQTVWNISEWLEPYVNQVLRVPAGRSYRYYTILNVKRQQTIFERKLRFVVQNDDSLRLLQIEFRILPFVKICFIR